ncbi:MAG: serpin family protein [Bacilli bacterium]|nr:serpin family protein [Bacilli bacterium]
MKFRKIFLILLLFFGSLVLVGCKNSSKPIKFEDSDNFKTLNSVTYPNLNYKADTLSTEAITALESFSYQTISELFVNEENYIYSPLSLYMALSMLLEGVSTPMAKTELESLLGLSKESIRDTLKTVYQNNYYKNKNGIMKLANSIWFRNNYPVEEDYLNALSAYYYAESYQTDFGSLGHQNIVDWINYYTEDFLNLTKEKFPIPSTTVILLLNTIYFDNKWQVAFDQKYTHSAEFYSSASTVQVDFMKHTVSSKYKESEKYIVAQDYFENNNSITYILPKDSINVLDLLTLDTLMEADSFPNEQKTDVSFIVPKFKYFSDFDLNQPLNNLGINEVFSSLSNSLELMAKDCGLYVSKVKQNAGIEFSEAGVKAAAVTSIIIKESASEAITLNLNRPFIYIIKDSSGIPLFVGILQNPRA